MLGSPRARAPATSCAVADHHSVGRVGGEGCERKPDDVGLRASAAVESCTGDNVEVFVQTEVLHDALSEGRRLRRRHG